MHHSIHKRRICFAPPCLHCILMECGWFLQLFLLYVLKALSILASLEHLPLTVTHSGSCPGLPWSSACRSDSILPTSSNAKKVNFAPSLALTSSPVQPTHAFKAVVGCNNKCATSLPVVKWHIRKVSGIENHHRTMGASRLTDFHFNRFLFELCTMRTAPTCQRQ